MVVDTKVITSARELTNCTREVNFHKSLQAEEGRRWRRMAALAEEGVGVACGFRSVGERLGRRGTGRERG
nr:hypothetical protein Iba_chr15bCG9930 [Ipomoea batatas]